MHDEHKCIGGGGGKERKCPEGRVCKARGAKKLQCASCQAMERTARPREKADIGEYVQECIRLMKRTTIPLTAQ